VAGSGGIHVEGGSKRDDFFALIIVIHRNVLLRGDHQSQSCCRDRKLDVKKGDTPRVQTSLTAFEPRKAEEGEDEEDEVLEIRMPGSFDFGNSGAAAPVAGAVEVPTTVDPLDVVGVLGNLWGRMQLR
jgi:hypothetical protein